MTILNKTSFFATLDEAFTRPENPAVCWGNFRVAKSILPTKGFCESEYFDVFSVLMAQGGYCDCEILYNVPHETVRQAPTDPAKNLVNGPRLWVIISPTDWNRKSDQTCRINLARRQSG